MATDIDFDKVLPDKAIEAALLDNTFHEFTGTFSDWNALRAAHFTAVEEAIETNDFLRALVGSKIADDFMETVVKNSKPTIGKGEPTPPETVVGIKLPISLLLSVVVSLVLIITDDGVRENTNEEYVEGTKILDHAWKAFKPQVAALVPGFGDGLE